MTTDELKVLSGMICEVVRLREESDLRLKAVAEGAEEARGRVAEIERDRDEVIRKFGAFCRVVNTIAGVDFDGMTGRKCKEYCIGFRDRVRECVDKNDIHFVQGGAR